jgi:hypothetical protein
MKVVVSNSDVAHLFANQTQSHARNSNGSLYFYNENIYSYGTHFCIAKFVDSYTLLFTLDTYGNTTAKQKLIVANATSHINKIYCFNPTGSHDSNFGYWLELSEGILSKLDRANKPEKYISELNHIKLQVYKYATYFNILVPTLLVNALSVTQKNSVVAYMESRAEIIAKELKEKQQKAAKEFKKKLTEWRNFKTSRLHSRVLGKDYIRVNKDNFETSQGVKIPIEVGKRFYNNLSNVQPGDKFLDFTIKAIDKKQLVIGCHNIDITEINKAIKSI